MERLHGVPLTDLAAIRSITSADPEQTLITALNTWFGSVLGCETFHADVHAGALCLEVMSVDLLPCACMLKPHLHAGIGVSVHVAFHVYAGACVFAEHICAAVTSTGLPGSARYPLGVFEPTSELQMH